MERKRNQQTIERDGIPRAMRFCVQFRTSYSRVHRANHGSVSQQMIILVTIYVDQFSDLSYAFLQEYARRKETFKGKLAFEQYARKVGDQIEHYHTDNRMFAENAFINHVKEQGQAITYRGVNAHYQNGKVEKRIRDLQERTRS